MPEENNEILKHNHGKKHMKASFVTCHINPKNPLTTKINKHTPFDFSFFFTLLIWCYKRFTRLLWRQKFYEQALQRFERTRNENNKPWTKGILPLTIEESKLYHKQKVSYIYKNKISTDDKKVRNHRHFNGKHRRAAHNACNLNYKTSKESHVVFYNGSSYDYHLIIKEPAKEFK